jgi:molybdate transport system substrate-binding protein
MQRILQVAFVGMALLIAPRMVEAAEVRVLSLPPLRSALSELVPQYQQASGHKVTITYGTPPQLIDRLQASDAADLVIMTPDALAGLQQQNKLEAGTVRDFAKVGMGVLSRKGVSKPYIGSVDGFKRALIASKSIAYIDPASGAPGGIYLAQLFERLGIAADLKPKTKHFGPSGAEAAVASGEVELGLSQITVILASPGVELVGHLPTEIQNYLHFAAAVVQGTPRAAEAKGLMEFIASPSAVAAMRAKGFE